MILNLILNLYYFVDVFFWSWWVGLENIWVEAEEIILLEEISLWLLWLLVIGGFSLGIQR